MKIIPCFVHDLSCQFLSSLLAFLAQLLSPDKSHTQNLHWICVCLRLGENFTWCLAIGDSNSLTVSPCVTSPFLTAGPVPSQASQLPPQFPVLLRPPREPSFPAGSSPHAHQRQVPSYSCSFGLRITDLETFSVIHQVSPGTHMLVHVFTHNESFHLMGQFVLSTWPHFLYFIEGHEHVKIRRLFSKSHSHLGVKAGTLIPSLNQSFQRLKIFPLSYGIIWPQNEWCFCEKLMIT